MALPKPLFRRLVPLYDFAVRSGLPTVSKMATIPEALAIAIQHHENGRLQAAEQIYRQILAVQPNHADAIHFLGVIAAQVGNREAAVEFLRRAIGLNGNVAAYHNNLGNVLNDQGKLDEAVECYRRALVLKPDHAEAHNNLGAVLKGQGKLDEAVQYCRRAGKLKPDYAEAHNNLGVALKEQGKFDEAVAACRQAVKLKPDYAEAHSNLGDALKEQGKLDEAVACYRRALELKPDYADAHVNLGIALSGQGSVEQAIACWRRALELKPDCIQAHSNLLMGLQYRTGVTPAALAEAHADYDRRHAAALRGPIVPNASVRNLHAPLRLGFVSPDLGRHPVGFFLVRVLENLDKKQVETICYSDRTLKDDLTHRLQAAATQWRDTVGVSHQRLTEQVRADRIDILFDLAGHTANNRLPVFVQKPAPIQVTWAGYVGTTGLEAMDYLLADRYEVPPGAEGYYRERVLRMPDGYVCYDPPVYAPVVAPLPALKRGHLTLGCFNNPAKITPQAIRIWARILHRLPEARLVLKFKGWDNRSVARRFTEMFVAQAIDPGRLELLGSSPHADLLAEYNRIDLALDPFPYSGGLTTCEALWMGVPVVTYPGETFAGRHSLSHLSNVCLVETIVGSLDEYVELAVSLAGDLPRLAALRAGLRERMADSPLCDGKRFANNFMSLLQGVWQLQS